ncbi:MAG: hypothetical protein WA633_02575 [Stellaceae bacterium]
MTTFNGAVQNADSRLEVGWKFPDFVTLGWWVNPAVGLIGALVLGGYFLTATPVGKAPASIVVVEAARPTPPSVSAQLALISDTSAVARSSAGPAEVFGAVLAFAGVMTGAWLGVRRARALDPDPETLTGNAGNGRRTETFHQRVPSLGPTELNHRAAAWAAAR